MKISKDSWHFKLVNFFSGDQYAYRINCGRISNCQHIRKTLFSLMSLTGIMTLCGFVIFTLFLGYVALPLWLIFDIEFFNLSKESTGPFSDQVNLALLVDILTIFFGLFFLLKHFIFKWIKNYSPKPKVVKPKVDGFIKSYFKAKNEKICTRVEFVEGEK